jgi:hypothetical protein
MPFKSKAQRRKFAALLVEGEISPETYEEWNRETGGKTLPERVKQTKKAKRVTKKTKRATKKRATKKMARLVKRQRRRTVSKRTRVATKRRAR